TTPHRKEHRKDRHELPLLVLLPGPILRHRPRRLGGRRRRRRRPRRRRLRHQRPAYGHPPHPRRPAPRDADTVPHQPPAPATPVLTRTKQTIGYVAPVPVPAGEDPWTGEQLPPTVRYAAWLADGTPAGGGDSYRYTVLTYGHDRYDT